ncbi:MAG: GAF domain-containing sensor histidine kinase, partial [Anaerolineae bacterium]
TLVGSCEDPCCAIYVPMVAESRVIGLLDLQSYREHAYTEEDGVWLGGVANLIGLAIQQARLYAEAQRTAIAEERNRLAGELHDAVSQTLFSSNLAAESLIRAIDHNPQQLRAGLVKLQQLNRGALAEMRTLLMELRPATLLRTQLKVLLEQLAAAVLGRITIEIATELEDVPALPPEVHIAFYRIAQEALNNIVKHASATRAELYLRQENRIIELVVLDNGCGFDNRRISPEHQGLQIMTERAHKVDIKLEISSIIGQGTQVKACWEAR